MWKVINAQALFRSNWRIQFFIMYGSATLDAKTRTLGELVSAFMTIHSQRIFDFKIRALEIEDQRNFRCGKTLLAITIRYFLSANNI